MASQELPRALQCVPTALLATRCLKCGKRPGIFALRGFGWAQRKHELSCQVCAPLAAAEPVPSDEVRVEEPVVSFDRNEEAHKEEEKEGEEAERAGEAEAVGASA